MQDIKNENDCRDKMISRLQGNLLVNLHHSETIGVESPQVNRSCVCNKSALYIKQIFAFIKNWKWKYVA